MQLFITPSFSGRIIGTQRFLESQPITIENAVKLMRGYDVRIAYGESKTVRDTVNQAYIDQIR
jgi:hypothetical protein